MSSMQAPPWQTPSRWRNHLGVIVTLGVIVVYLLGMELAGNLPHGLTNIDDPASTRNFVNILARASVTLISTVLASLFLAIPLTANNYTPQLIELFVRSWLHRIVLGLFVFSAAFAVWLSVLTSDDSIPRTHIFISLILVMTSLAALLPYLFTVLRLLDPDTIIRLVSTNVAKAMRPCPPGRITASQLTLARRIGQLGNIVLRSIDRSDRDTALTSIEAVESTTIHYLQVKRQHVGDWFKVDSDLFPGLSPEAIEFLSRDRTWVEMDLLRQLARAYAAALSKMPDVLSAICRTNRHVAVAAAIEGDDEVLRLVVRYFNNDVREAVKKRDLHAVYDTLYQYRHLATRILEYRKDEVTNIAEHLVFYGRMALAAGIPFAHDLVAYDLGAIIATAARRGDVTQLLSTFLDVGKTATGGTDLTPGIVKARLILAAHLEQAQREREARTILDSLLEAGDAVLATAKRDLLSETAEAYWEVTDRQLNLDWLPDAGRAIVARYIEEVVAARRKDAGGRE